MKNLVVIASCFIFSALHTTTTMAGEYPTEVNQRPLTLPSGTIQVGTDLTFIDKFETIGLDIGLGYGITDELSVSLDGLGAIFAPDFGVSKVTHLGFAYSLLNQEAFHMAPSFGLTFDFNENADALGAVSVGLDSRFNLMDDKLSLHFGHGLFTYVPAGDGSWLLNVQLGIAYQVDTNIYARVDTWLFGVQGLPDPIGTQTTHIGDTTPTTLTLGYAIDNTMDLGVQLGVDLQDAAETMNVGLTFTWRKL